MPAHLRHFAKGRARDLLQCREIGADDLHRIGAFDARQPLLDVVLDVLGEVKVDADELFAKFRLKLLNELLFGHTAWPFVKRLERHEELGVEETRCVTAIVRSAVL